MTDEYLDLDNNDVDALAFVQANVPGGEAVTRIASIVPSQHIISFRLWHENGKQRQFSFALDEKSFDRLAHFAGEWLAEQEAQSAA